MAGNTYQLVVDAVYKGGDAFRQAQRDLGGIARPAMLPAGWAVRWQRSALPPGQRGLPSPVSPWPLKKPGAP